MYVYTYTLIHRRLHTQHVRIRVSAEVQDLHPGGRAAEAGSPARGAVKQLIMTVIIIVVTMRTVVITIVLLILLMIIIIMKSMILNI